jgi:hypothetical protein
MNTLDISDYQPADMTSAGIFAAVTRTTDQIASLEAAMAALAGLVTKTLLTSTTLEIAAAEEQQNLHAIDIRRLKALREVLAEKLAEAQRSEKITDLRQQAVEAAAVIKEGVQCQLEVYPRQAEALVATIRKIQAAVNAMRAVSSINAKLTELSGETVEIAAGPDVSPAAISMATYNKATHAHLSELVVLPGLKGCLPYWPAPTA